jgi:Gas vesicle synthesis protein GvpL/GvpF
VTVYVYGVAPDAENDALSAPGVQEAGVRTVSHRGLAALVSDLEGDALSAPKEVRAHWRVLEQASAAATVLPVRFGTVMAGEDAVRSELLEPNADRLTGLLRELAGRVQLAVKADYDNERLLREVVNESPPIAALRARVHALPEEAGYYDRIRLGELVAAEIDRRRERDTRQALERLAPLAIDTREEALATAEAAFNLAFLVERDRVDGFSQAVKRLADEVGDRLRFRYLGPLPPYSFADAQLSSEGAGWG